MVAYEGDLSVLKDSETKANGIEMNDDSDKSFKLNEELTFSVLPERKTEQIYL